MKESFENLIEMWGNCEEVLYLISNKSGELPREGVRDFAKPFSGKIEKALELGSVNLQTEEDLINFVKSAQIYRDTKLKDRSFGINFTNIGTEKNTIEFRLPNGTLDADCWIQNINLFGGIIKSCQDLALIQTKEGVLSEEEKNKLEIFEKLKNTKDNNKKLELLLLLIVPEENRHIYKERFEVNNKLLELEENKQVNAIITAKLASKPIDIKKYKSKDIVVSVFGGDEPVTGNDYETGARFFENDLGENEINHRK